jgi:LEA14-like dessication related protein
MSGARPGSSTDGSADAASEASADASTDSSGGVRSRAGALVSTWPRRIAVGIVALVAVLAVLYLTGIIGAPSAGLADRGDWGEVTDERTEIVTTVWVNNPNPVGLSLGESLTADYDIYMNGVRVAEGSKSDITVPTGNSTTALSTDLLNDQLPTWWVAFVRADETVELDVNATLTVDALATVEHDVHVNRTILENDRPVIGALSAAANGTTGTYTESVDASQYDDAVLDDADATGDSSVTAGYEIERGWATWESVSEEETTAVIHLRVHNPGDVPVPAAPDGVGVAIDMNDVGLFEGETDEFTLRSVDEGTMIPPGETQNVTFTVTMDNDKVDEWFTGHVREDVEPGEEATAVSAQFQVVFEEPVSGTTFRLPADSPATYDCEFRTAILVDDRETATDCGEGANPDRPGTGGASTAGTDAAGGAHAGLGRGEAAVDRDGVGDRFGVRGCADDVRADLGDEGVDGRGRVRRLTGLGPSWRGRVLDARDDAFDVAGDVRERGGGAGVDEVLDGAGSPSDVVVVADGAFEESGGGLDGVDDDVGGHCPLGVRRVAVVATVSGE